MDGTKKRGELARVSKHIWAKIAAPSVVSLSGYATFPLVSH